MVYAKINPLLCDFLWGRGREEGDPQQHRGNAWMTAGIVDTLFPLSFLADPERKLPSPAQPCPCTGGTNGFVLSEIIHSKSHPAALGWVCGCPDVGTHISSPGWAQESWNHACLPLQASLALHLHVGGGQRAQAVAADNTPGWAGKWQGKGRLLISLQHGLSGALGCLSPWLPPSRCLGYHPSQAAEGRLTCGMGCGRAVLHWPVAARDVPGDAHGPWVGLPSRAAQFIPDVAHSLDVPKAGEARGFPLAAWTASVRI